MDEKLTDVPIMIFANKQDLENVMKVSEIAEAIGLVKLKDRTWQIQECSALEGTGIKVSEGNTFIDIFIFFSFQLLIFRKEWIGFARTSERIEKQQNMFKSMSTFIGGVCESKASCPSPDANVNSYFCISSQLMIRTRLLLCCSRSSKIICALD